MQTGSNKHQLTLMHEGNPRYFQAPNLLKGIAAFFTFGTKISAYGQKKSMYLTNQFLYSRPLQQ
jgi:hypothetical protein